MTLTRERLAWYRSRAQAMTGAAFRDAFQRPGRLTPELEHAIETALANRDEALRFYEAAVAREEALVRNTLAAMERAGQPVAALVAGGFHTPGLTQRLKSQGIAYAVIAPTFEGEMDEARYHALLHDRLPSVETLLNRYLASRPSPLLRRSEASALLRSSSFEAAAAKLGPSAERSRASQRRAPLSPGRREARTTSPLPPGERLGEGEALSSGQWTMPDAGHREGLELCMNTSEYGQVTERVMAHWPTSRVEGRLSVDGKPIPYVVEPFSPREARLTLAGSSLTLTRTGDTFVARAGQGAVEKLEPQPPAEAQDVGDGEEGKAHHMQLRHQPEEGPGKYNTDLLEGIQHEQIVVRGHQVADGTSQGAVEEDVVLGISARPHQVDGLDDDGILVDHPEQRADLFLASQRLEGGTRQNLDELGQRFGGEHRGEGTTQEGFIQPSSGSLAQQSPYKDAGVNDGAKQGAARSVLGGPARTAAESPQPRAGGEPPDGAWPEPAAPTELAGRPVPASASAGVLPARQDDPTTGQPIAPLASMTIPGIPSAWEPPPDKDTAPWTTRQAPQPPAGEGGLVEGSGLGAEEAGMTRGKVVRRIEGVKHQIGVMMVGPPDLAAAISGGAGEASASHFVNRPLSGSKRLSVSRTPRSRW